MNARSDPAQKLPPSGRIAEILERTAELYSRNLQESTTGRELLRRLGLDDLALIERHRIGWCDGTMRRTLPSHGRVRDELGALGILVPGERNVQCERFSGCLTFPVRDIDGRLVNLYAENGAPDAHTAVLPDLPLTVWNAPVAKRSAEVLITRSILDALALERAGIHNVAAAPPATPEAELARLGSLGANGVFLNAEPDAEAEGSHRSSGDPGIHLPDGLTPRAFLLRYGADALSRAVQEALERSRQCPEGSGGDLKLQFGPRLYTVYGLTKSDSRLNITLRAEHHGRLHVDTLNLYRASLRRRLCADLTRLFDEVPEVIEADVAKLTRACEEHDPEQQMALDGAQAMSAEERAAAETFGRSPDLLERIRTDYARCGLVGEEPNTLLCYLAAVSRKMDEPLSVLILSSSGAGKSALQNVTLAFCPPEDVVRLTSLTGKALFYQDPTSLRHRVLALAETAGGEDAIYAIRSLISEGELVVSTTVRDRNSSGLTTVENRVEGPTAVFCTTTNPAVDPETRSRFFVIGVDESDEQTARVLAWQRQRLSLPDTANTEAVDTVRRLHRNFQRLLRPLRVVNPFAPRLTYGRGRLQSRREQPRYLALINAVAFLRQMSRPLRTTTIDGRDVDVIDVELDDIAVANRIAASALSHSVDELSRPARELLQVLDDLVKERLAQAELAEDDPSAVSFTRREVREFSGWSHYRVHTHLKELLELQYIFLDSRGQAGLHRYHLAPKTDAMMAGLRTLGLTPVEALRAPVDAVASDSEFGESSAEFGSGADDGTCYGKDANSTEFGNSANMGEKEA